MKWNSFKTKTPHKGTYVLVSDGSSLGLVYIEDYPFVYQQLYSTCCKIHLSDMKYWLSLSDIPLPECEDCLNKSAQWAQLIDPGLYKEIQGASETIQEEKTVSVYQAAIGDTEID